MDDQKEKQQQQQSAVISRRVCVVGASGLVGSFLVKKLLERENIAVHATIRNTNGDPEKAALLKRLPGADSRLRLFEADLFHPDQVEEAILGCEFVFLVAFPTKPSSSDADMDAAGEAIMASLRSVLTTCERSGTVRRIIYTGSVMASSPLDEQGVLSRDLLDESCWTNPNAPLPYPSDSVKFYTRFKTAHDELLVKAYAAKEGMDPPAPEVVVLACGLIGGEGLVGSVSAVGPLVSPFTRDPFYLPAFVFLQRLLCCVPLVHLYDVCEAHIFCMDVPLVSCTAERFLVASDYPSLQDMMAYYRQNWPELIASEPVPDELGGKNSSIRCGSSKLGDMGFTYRYRTKEILDESVAFAKKLGIIKDC